jgi:transposase
MKAYSEDLRKKIVAAIERGMSKAEAARTFSVSLSLRSSDTPGSSDRESLSHPKRAPDGPAKQTRKLERS